MLQAPGLSGYFGISEIMVDGELEAALLICPSRPTQEGRCATSSARGGERWTPIALLTKACEADGEDVWS